MRWRMCRKCGVKIGIDVIEEEVTIFICPVCKNGEMDIKGKLLSELERISKDTGKSIEDLILEALKKYGE